MKFSKFALCASSSVLALNVAAYSYAAEQQQAADPAVEEVIVTGSRIQISGYEQPTPVTVVGTEQIENSAAQNIADFVSQMPAVTGSASPQSSNAGLSAHSAGLSTLSLRGLGGSRTLILLDGQRSVGSTTAGLVDINDIPQDLVARVDVVTGGASAAYGSDALSGVVNFILDKNYVGTKGEVSGSLTTYGDNPQWKVRLTNGSTFGGDKGHLLLSGEMAVRYGIWGVPREWNNTGALIINNPAYGTGAGQTRSVPALLNVRGAVPWQATRGGVITSAGPLKGVYFGPNGTPNQIRFDGIVGNPYAVTSDYRSLLVNDNVTLDPYGASQRMFARASYQLTDHINGFVQLSWSHNHGVGWDVLNFKINNITVKSDNAYIPASVAAVIAANGITQFTMGSYLEDLGIAGNNSDRFTNRYVVGFDGDFDAFDTNWKWNAYYQKGQSRTSARIESSLRNDRFTTSVDAVRGPSGAIVCRSTLTNPTNGCVPYNLFGQGVNSQTAINYLSGRPDFDPGKTGFPQLNEHFYQDVMAVDMQGSPFSSWAGPVSVAFGVEHRKERGDGRADAQSGAWLIGNYIPTVGGYNVTEGFVEGVVPLARDQVWAQSLDLNAAVRATSYSISGYVTTWKVGATWDIIPDLRVRVTRSRDIRAPNLNELYSSGAGGTTTLIDRFHGTTPVNNIGLTVGNLALTPEKADTTGIGVVVQPQFIPGLSASVDYYNINIKDVIGSIGGQTVIDYCFNGLKQFCAAITPDLSTLAVTPTQIVVKTQPFNFATRLARGLDVEFSYGTNLDNINSDWNGSAEVRVLATRYLKDIQDNLISPPANSVGDFNVPKWRYSISANYSNEPFSLTLGARGISAGVLNTTRIQCTTGCPISTTDNQTIDDNSLAGAWYYDASVNYTFHVGEDGANTIQAYLNIQNLLNTDPVIYPQVPTGIPWGIASYLPQLYDGLGRVFRAGIRFKM